MAGHSPVGHLCRPLADHHHVPDDLLTVRAEALGAPSRPSAAQCLDQLRTQTATPLQEQGTVDRLVGHTPAWLIWMLITRPLRDLLRGPSFEQPLLDNRRQLP